MLVSSLLSPVVRKVSSANTWPSERLGKPGILPLPFRMVIKISVPDMRSPTPTSDGNSGGEPCMFSP